jgi:hypothetical protein
VSASPRLGKGIVVIRLKVDGLLLDVGEDLVRQLVQTNLGVSLAAALSPSIEPKLPWPSTSGYRIEKSCARRTRVS